VCSVYARFQFSSYLLAGAYVLRLHGDSDSSTLTYILCVCRCTLCIMYIILMEYLLPPPIINSVEPG
jgi:hypothetical protein